MRKKQGESFQPSSNLLPYAFPKKTWQNKGKCKTKLIFRFKIYITLKMLFREPASSKITAIVFQFVIHLDVLNDSENH